MRFALPLLVSALAGCAEPPPAPPSQQEADLAAVRAVVLTTPALSWDALRIHPVLAQRPCAVDTLVNEQSQVVGYCSRGRNCRTNDWRPVADGCPMPGGPAFSPAAPGTALELAGRR